MCFGFEMLKTTFQILILSISSLKTLLKSLKQPKICWNMDIRANSFFKAIHQHSNASIVAMN